MHHNVSRNGYSTVLNRSLVSFGSDKASRVQRPAGKRSSRRHSAAFLGFLVGLIGFARAEAGSTFLGAASNYNVYVSGNMTQYGGDVATSVAVGGNLSSSQFTIAGVGGGDSLVVGGNLGYTNAEIQSGNAQVGGTVTMGSNDNSALANGETLYYGSTTGNSFPSYPHFTTTYEQNGGISSTLFSGANATLVNDSSILAAQTANGTVTSQYGILTLTGTSGTTDYFNVTAAQLQGANTLNISAPAGATVIVNVSGQSDQFEYAGMNVSGTSEDKVLFNFYQATSLSLAGVAFEGSILAPDAILTGSSGHTDGNVMVDGISATNYSFEYHDNGLFDGDPTITAVSEPSTLVLAGLGIVFMGLIVVRRRGWLTGFGGKIASGASAS